MKKLILIKTCQTFFDKQNRLAGWYDVGLSQQGIEQAKQLAYDLKQNNIKIDYAFMSVLLRAEQTYQTIAKELGYKIRSFKSYKLNDRHLGILQGLSVDQAKELYGKDIIQSLTQKTDYMPPYLPPEHFQNPNNDELYSGLKEQMPLAETLTNAYDRSTDYISSFVLKTIKNTQTGLVIVDEQIYMCLQKYFTDIVKIEQFSNYTVLNLDN